MNDIGSVISKLLEEEREYRLPSPIENFNMESVIKWQTGEPKESGLYLVTTYYGKVKVDEFCHYSVSGKEYGTFIKYADPVAWCKLSDIEPYKEG